MKTKKAAILTALTALPLTGVVATPAHAASWHDTGQSFYWYASCESAGKAGMASGWQAYDCKGSAAPWSSYELWGLY